MHVNSRILNEMFFSGVEAKRSLEPIWGNGVSEYWGAGPSSARKLWRAGQAEPGTNMGRGGVLEYWRTEAGRHGLRDCAEGSARALNPTREARVPPSGE